MVVSEGRLYEGDPANHRSKLAQLLVTGLPSLALGGLPRLARPPVQLLRQLYEKDPAQQCPLRAQTLRSLGGAFLAAERFAESCVAEEKAVALQHLFATGS